MLSFDAKRTKVILVGTSEYECFDEINPIKNNLADLKQVFVDKKIIGIQENEDLISIENIDNNRSLKKIRDVIKDEDNIDFDTLIFYYSGHGYRKRNKGGLFLASQNSDTDIITSFIHFNDLKELIENSHFQKRIIIIDACHSGLAAMDLVSDKFSEEELTFENEIKSIENKGTFVLTSCAGSKKSYFKNEERNTYFTGALVNILKQGIRDKGKVLSLNNIYAKICKDLQRRELPMPQRKSTFSIPEFSFCYNQSHHEEKQTKIKRQQSKVELILRQQQLEDELWKVTQLIERPISYNLYLEKYPKSKFLNSRFEYFDSEDKMWSYTKNDVAKLSKIFDDYVNQTKDYFPYDDTIGISIGENYSAVSISQIGETFSLTGREHTPLIPTLISIVGEDEIKVGHPAERIRVAYPESTFSHTLGLIGKSINQLHEENESLNFIEDEHEIYVTTRYGAYALVKLLSHFIKYLKKMAEDYHGREIEHGIIAIPSRLTNNAAKVIKKASSLVNMEVSIVDEITALSSYLSYSKFMEKGEYRALLLYIESDNVTIHIYEHYDNVNNILATQTVRLSGLNAIDQILIDHLNNEFKKRNGEDIAFDPMVQQRLKESVIKLRNELAISSSGEINLPYITAINGMPTHLTHDLNREQFNSLIHQHVDNILTQCAKTIESQGFSIDDIDEFIQIGNEVNIPLISELIKKRFDKSTLVDDSAQEALAKGSALFREKMESLKKAKTLIALCTECLEEDNQFPQYIKQGMEYYVSKLKHDVDFAPEKIKSTVNNLLELIQSLKE